MESSPHSEKQSQKNRRFTDDRIQLLDTIRAMIDLELDRREQARNSAPPPGKPPPKGWRSLWDYLTHWWR